MPHVELCLIPIRTLLASVFNPGCSDTLRVVAVAVFYLPCPLFHLPQQRAMVPLLSISPCSQEHPGSGGFPALFLNPFLVSRGKTIVWSSKTSKMCLGP